jgi:hypothetical protein
MDTPETVPASEFTRNFGRYRMRAQRGAVAVSSHGQITGYFLGPDEYEGFLPRGWLSHVARDGAYSLGSRPRRSREPD